MTSDQLSSTMVDDSSLRHFGVKGMHWGVHHSREQLLAKASNHEQLSAEHAKEAKRFQAEHEELMQKGLNSAAAKRVYGENAAMQSDGYFRLVNGQTRGQAIDQLSNNLRLMHNHHARMANHHTSRAAKLRKKADSMEHGALAIADVVDEVDDFLIHFGVKGMHWGVHRQGAETGPPSHDAAAAAMAHQKAKEGGGTHVLSNAELEALTKRLNLETQYKRLTTQTGDSSVQKVKKGKDFVGDVIGVGKMGVDAYETGKKIKKIVDEISATKKK